MDARTLHATSVSLKDFLDREFPEELAAFRKAMAVSEVLQWLANHRMGPRPEIASDVEREVESLMQRCRSEYAHLSPLEVLPFAADAAAREADRAMEAIERRLRAVMLSGQHIAHCPDPRAVSPTFVPVPYGCWLGFALHDDFTGVSSAKGRASFEHVRIVPASTVSPPDQLAPREAKPRVSQAAFEAWYRERVDGHVAAGTVPSRADDETAAKETFPGIGRETVRNARHRLAPENWKERGRREG